ncbi:MAG: VOC family protein [Acidimicrobiia bacterium]|nr:VOC family protein [Acidimicrobiia bacterium]
MSARLVTIVIDVRDPVAMAEFWMDVLGWQCLDTEDDGAIAIGPPENASSVTLLFEPVPETKTMKNRVHLDLRAVACEQDDELGRLLALGAERVDIGQGDQTWVVLADPEGNEFCLLRTPAEP